MTPFLSSSQGASVPNVAGMTSENLAPSGPQACLCRGTGAYTVDITLADAVVSDLRLCLEHGLTPRARLLDTTTGRVGELMEVSVANRRVWLRPAGGGREWSADTGGLRPAPTAP